MSRPSLKLTCHPDNEILSPFPGLIDWQLSSYLWLVVETTTKRQPNQDMILECALELASLKLSCHLSPPMATLSELDCRDRLSWAAAASLH